MHGTVHGSCFWHNLAFLLISFPFDLDEQDCSLPDSIFPICLAATAIFGSILAFVMWYFTVGRLAALDQAQIQLTDDFEALHQTHELKRFMHTAQTLNNAREINKEYISNEINWHNGSTCEVVCCCKVSTVTGKENVFKYLFHSEFVGYGNGGEGLS